MGKDNQDEEESSGITELSDDELKDAESLIGGTDSLDDDEVIPESLKDDDPEE